MYARADRERERGQDNLGEKCGQSRKGLSPYVNWTGVESWAKYYRQSILDL